MKIKAIVFSAVVASILSTPVLASLGNTTQNLPLLERGVSSTQMLAQGHPKRFNINIEQATTLKVVSEHFPGFTSTGNRISAVRQLQPGNYQLEVTGRSSGGSDDNRYYELHVAY